MQTESRPIIGSGGVSLVIKAAQVCPFPVRVDVCDIPACPLVEADAFEARGTVAAKASVLIILRMGTQPEVFFPVIQLVPVGVVDLRAHRHSHQHLVQIHLLSADGGADTAPCRRPGMGADQRLVLRIKQKRRAVFHDASHVFSFWKDGLAFSAALREPVEQTVGVYSTDLAAVTAAQQLRFGIRPPRQRSDNGPASKAFIDQILIIHLSPLRPCRRRPPRKAGPYCR